MRCLVLFCVLFVCVEFGVVNCLKASQKGVCVVKHTVTKTRPKTVLVTTSNWCGAKKCTFKQTRRQKYTVVSNQLMCCKGYVYTSDTDSCAPVCSTGCENGTCVNPDLCQCTPPLYLDPITRNKCLTPTCDHECVDSFCSANNTCVCDKNFVEYNVTHCAKNCSEGFVLDSSLNCVPKCQNCTGKCIAPGTCVCEHGYKYNGTCEPVCDPPCLNGRCAAPNTCLCDSGFVKKNASVCQKREHSGCVGECRSNGTCLTQIS